MNHVRKMIPVAFLGLVATLAAAGCDRDRDRERGVTVEHGPVAPNRPTETPSPATHPETAGQTTVTNANIGVANQAAIGRLVAARCAREQACSNVGVDKHYTNPQACTQKVSADMKDDLNAQDCPYGVDAKGMGDCLEAIRKEACNNPIDSLSRIAACRTGELCLKSAPPKP